MIFFVPIYFGPSHIRLYLEIIWSRIKLFNHIATVIMSFQLFYVQSSLIKSYASGPFKIFMITKRDNYMGRHLILALFEEGPILHLNFLAWGPLFLTLSFFLIASEAERIEASSQSQPRFARRESSCTCYSGSGPIAYLENGAFQTYAVWKKKCLF